MRQGQTESGNSTDYMQQARECVARAELAHTARDRLSLLEMAQGWAHLAERSAEIGRLMDQAREQGLLPQKTEMH